MHEGLSQLKKKVKKEDIGLYRDDGLIILKHQDGHISDKLKTDIIQIFQNIGFKIEIRVMLKIVDFLDVTLNLNKTHINLTKNLMTNSFT